MILLERFRVSVRIECERSRICKRGTFKKQQQQQLNQQQKQQQKVSHIRIELRGVVCQAELAEGEQLRDLFQVRESGRLTVGAVAVVAWEDDWFRWAQGKRAVVGRSTCCCVFCCCFFCCCFCCNFCCNFFCNFCCSASAALLLLLRLLLLLLLLPMVRLRLRFRSQ